eukprot:Pgem_evm1s2208
MNWFNCSLSIKRMQSLVIHLRIILGTYKVNGFKNDNDKQQTVLNFIQNDEFINLLVLSETNNPHQYEITNDLNSYKRPSLRKLHKD